jgi:hypothetical protein
MKPTGKDQGFSTEGFPFISISIQLLSFVVTQGRVLFIVFIFIIDVVVLLLLLLLSKCALSCRATRYHMVVSHDEALAVVARSEVPTDQWADDWCCCRWCNKCEPSIIGTRRV